MKRAFHFLLLGMLVAGCGDMLTEPMPTESVRLPEVIAADIPSPGLTWPLSHRDSFVLPDPFLVQTALSAPHAVMDHEDSIEILSFQWSQRLFQNGRAVGTARLRHRGNPPHGYNFQFHEGRLACELEMPVIYLTATMRKVPSGSRPKDAGAADMRSGKLVRFSLMVDPAEGPGNLKQIGLAMHDYHNTAGEPILRFTTEMQLYLASDPCRPVEPKPLWEHRRPIHP